jgi:hypothetical protein
MTLYEKFIYEHSSAESFIQIYVYARHMYRRWYTSDLKVVVTEINHLSNHGLCHRVEENGIKFL